MATYQPMRAVRAIELLVIAALSMAGGCLHDDPPISYPQEVKVDETKLPLGPGDKLNLTVYYGSKSIQAQYTLDPSGMISVQFIGAVQAGGKTLPEVRKDIKTRLEDGYLNEPIVELTLVELNSLTVAVSGMVAKTGTVKFTPGMSIVDVIALSGGFTPMARKNLVRVVRVENNVPATYKLPVEMMAEGIRPRFPMLPGDEVFVPERPW